MGPYMTPPPGSDGPYLAPPPAREEAWREARPCQTCGRSGWCSVTSDGRTWICRRQAGPDGQERRDRHGVPYWLHGDPTARTPVAPAGPAPADRDVLDAVYRDLLAGLELEPDHRQALVRRGLPEYAIRRCRTWNRGRLASLAARAAREWPDTIASVPGWRRNRGRPAWSGLPRGIAMPRYDLAGRVVAVQVRLDDPGPGGKYRYVSSRPDGPGPVMVASPALPPDMRRPGPLVAERVRLTEGWLGSWVCAELTGVLTVDVSGVAMWPLALPVLREVRCRHVLLAWDADWRANPAVRASLRAAVISLRGSGYRVQIESWDPALGRGLDDALMTLRGREVAA